MKERVKIIVLCGGRGARLGKLTSSQPKPLIRIHGKPILEHKLRYYRKQGFTEVICCIGYQGRAIVNYLQEQEIKVEFSDSGPDVGMLARIVGASTQIDRTAIVSYGDTYAEIDLSDLMDHHTKSCSKLTLVVAPIQNPFGIAQADDSDRVIDFQEKPILNHYIGYFVIDKDVFNYIPHEMINLGDGTGLVRLFQLLINNNQATAYRFNGLQVTFNTPEELAEAQNKLGSYYTLDEEMN